MNKSPRPVALLMDSPRSHSVSAEYPTKPTVSDASHAKSSAAGAVVTPVIGPQTMTLLPEAAEMMRLPTRTLTTSSDSSLGRLLVEMTAQVQSERSRRSDVEMRNQKLLAELEQLQTQVLELKTSHEQEQQQQQQQHQHQRRRGSSDWENAMRADMVRPNASTSSQDESSPSPSVPPAEAAAFYWQELQAAKQAREAAVTESQQRAVELVQLQACVSMQHDELKALRAIEQELQSTLAETEQRARLAQQQHELLVQENRVLQHDVAHAHAELGQRSSQFEALLAQYTDAQAHREHGEREARTLFEQLRTLRQAHEQHTHAMAQVQDERDALQHQVSQLKGVVAAKTAESRAFQAYGSNARDHLQAQQVALARHQVYRRQIHHVAREGVTVLHRLRATLASVRAPLVLVQAEFRAFLLQLRTPVLALATRSRQLAQAVHMEHAPLRRALQRNELARRHLHDQVWQAHGNALLVCQIRNLPPSTSSCSTAVSLFGDAAAVVASATTSPSSRMENGGSHRQGSKLPEPPVISLLTCPPPPFGTPTMTATPSSSPPTSTTTTTTTTMTLRANYSTRELLLRESDCETVTVRCDALYSDRARVLGAAAWTPHESVVPVLQSVLDGRDACVATFEGLPAMQTVASDCSRAVTEQSVAALVLTQLFAMLHPPCGDGPPLQTAKLTLSYLAVAHETIYDLLGMINEEEAEEKKDEEQQEEEKEEIEEQKEVEANSTMPATDALPVMNRIVVLDVDSVEDALLVLRGGLENLQAVQQQQQQQQQDPTPRGLDVACAHKVITVCVTHVNHLVSEASKGSSTAITSKLQIVELATGPDMAPYQEIGSVETEAHTAKRPDEAVSRSRDALRAQVAMENGLQALVTTLADVRIPDAAFVRYYSSKLTVLLQDTLTPTAKFLALVALPCAMGGPVPANTSPSRTSATGSAAACAIATPTAQQLRAARATRWLALLRRAVGPHLPRAVGGADLPVDRSVEGFINRFTQQQQQQQQPPRVMRQLAFAPPHAGTRSSSWESELERMGWCYGDLDALPVSCQTSPEPHELKEASTPHSQQQYYTIESSLQSQPQQQQQYESQEDASVPTIPVLQSTPTWDVSSKSSEVVAEPATTISPSASSSSRTRTLSRTSTRNNSSASSRSLGSRSSQGQRARRSFLSPTTATAAKARPSVSARRRQAPLLARSPSPSRAGSQAPRPTVPSLPGRTAAATVKVRRETASSALKKVLVGSHARAPSTTLPASSSSASYSFSSSSSVATTSSKLKPVPFR